MPASEVTFLVRDPGGHCHTVQARTPRGALRQFLFHNPRAIRAGEKAIVSVKPRGDGDWVDYKVER